jgi:o-succinylbenzoate---CoA ligase
VLAVASHSAYLLTLLVHATPRLGCALLPLDPALPRATLLAMLEQTGARFLITETFDAPFAIEVIEAATLLASLEENVPDFPPEPPVMPLGPDELHLIVATSGSEGEPKGAMLTGRNLAVSAQAARERLGLVARDCWLDCLPLHHIGGLAILYRCACAGAAVLHVDRFDAAVVWDLLRRHPVTHLSLVPVMLSRLLEACAAPPPPTLRRVLIGGAALPSKLAQRALELGWPLCASYGLTEAGSQVATLCNLPAGWTGGLVGCPLRGMEVRIDEGCGRIHIRGGAVMAGYANPALTPGLGLAPDGWFETADLGRLDAEGRLWVLGRADDVIVTGGVNVHPRQVEELLADCPGITEVAVTGRPDPAWGARLVAVMAGSAEPAQVEAWCRSHLSGALRPREFMKISELPRNAVGKLDRHRLRSLVLG